MQINTACKHFSFQVKINSQNEDMLRQACELFMGKKAAEIRNIALETMASTNVNISFRNNRCGDVISSSKMRPMHAKNLTRGCNSEEKCHMFFGGKFECRS